VTAEELEQTRQFLQRSLDDLELEHDAGDIEERDYEALRSKYATRAAEVQAELDAADADEMEEAPPRRVSRRAVAVIAIVAMLATGAGFFVASSSGERVAQAPATGSIDASTTDRLAQARQLLGEKKVVDAIKLYDQIIKSDPKNPEALAYRGWIVALAGLPDDGLAFVERAIAADPAYPDAHFFKGMILWQDKHQPAAAVPEFQLFLASNPPEDLRPQVEAAMQQAQGEANRQPAASSASSTSTTVGSAP
jgi:cytochrome c-type biogenesis protein CcmH/NrfG